MKLILTAKFYLSGQYEGSRWLDSGSLLRSPIPKQKNQQLVIDQYKIGLGKVYGLY